MVEMLLGFVVADIIIEVLRYVNISRLLCRQKLGRENGANSVIQMRVSYLS